MKPILILIPTYNERENIATIIETIYKVAEKSLKKYRVKVLVIDDNSPDGTQNVVHDLQKKYAGVQMITGQKAGLGKAYIRGFQYGLEHCNYEAFIMMDADFSHDPHAIPPLLAEIEQGADYVIGSRYVFGGSIPGSWPLIRIINSRVANNVARWLTGMDKDITDLTGGFKAIRATALKQIDLNSIDAAGYFFQVSLLHQFWNRKLVVREVPIVFADRRYGSSKLRLRDIMEFFYRAYRLNPNSRIRQLMRFAFVGACGSIVNLGILHIFIRYARLNPLIAVAIAIEVSIITNFFMNHYYTFRFTEGGGHHGVSALPTKLTKFNIGMLSGAAIQFSVFALLHTLAGLQYLIADILAIGVAMSWNYWVSTKYVWGAAGVKSKQEP